jgi:outer membrane protein TolC
MFRFAVTGFLTVAGAAAVFAQASGPLGYAIATPRPIDPAAGSSNPSARATQSLNPYLGSVPGGKAAPGELKLTLEDAIRRGLAFNLGQVESGQSEAAAQAERARAFSALLPQITARAEQSFHQVSIASIGLRLPPQAGFRLPQTTGGFGYSEGRIDLQYAAFDPSLMARYQARREAAEAASLSARDSRDVVVYAVGTAYFQVVSSEARLATARAALASAREYQAQTAHEVEAEVSPEIEQLRASVELHAAEQRVTDAENDLEKDKLTLDRIAGIPLEQKWSAAHEYGYKALPDSDQDNPQQTRFDLESARKSVSAAELDVKSASAERLPSVSLDASYGAGGMNPGNYSQVYAVGGSVSVPLFTGGRIRADIREAEARLAQRQAEARDLEGRVAYDVRVARLDAKASETAVKVAQANQALAARALAESQDRYANGVTNSLEVLQAREAVAAAGENYIASLFSFNVAKISLARALGNAETRLATFFEK